MAGATQAFLLGAGLGTRLRPLTDHVPKPLVSLFHKPLISWAVESCREIGIDRFAINTHYLPEKWSGFEERPEFGGASCSFFHETELLDTGGGLRNIRPWIEDGPLLVYNGDIFSTLPVEKLLETHLQSGLPATLALRSSGAEKRVAFDPATQRIIDVRHALGVSPGTHVFSGIYCIDPRFVEVIPDRDIVSVIPAFLHFAERGLLGAVVLDDGDWLDLGDRGSYLAAHHSLALAPPVHPTALVESGAVVEQSVLGAGAVVRAGAVVLDSVVWGGSEVASGSYLERCVLAGSFCPPGHHVNQDW